jgi:putative addiction module killer protein
MRYNAVMIEVRQTDTYSDWFVALRDRQARARIDIRIRRLSLGNPGDLKPVGEGVSELRIDYGSGYRVYFVQRGKTLVAYWQAATNAHKTATSKRHSNSRAARRSTSWQAS